MKITFFCHDADIAKKLLAMSESKRAMYMHLALKAHEANLKEQELTLAPYTVYIKKALAYNLDPDELDPDAITIVKREFMTRDEARQFSDDYLERHSKQEPLIFAITYNRQGYVVHI